MVTPAGVDGVLWQQAEALAAKAICVREADGACAYHREQAVLCLAAAFGVLQQATLDALADELGARYEKHRTEHDTHPGPYDEGYLDALDVAEQLARSAP